MLFVYGSTYVMKNNTERVHLHIQNTLFLYMPLKVTCNTRARMYNIYSALQNIFLFCRKFSLTWWYGMWRLIKARRLKNIVQRMRTQRPCCCFCYIKIYQTRRWPPLRTLLVFLLFQRVSLMSTAKHICEIYVNRRFRKTFLSLFCFIAKEDEFIALNGAVVSICITLLISNVNATANL